MIETHRSFANMWECDENDHMNVQFFIRRFDEAMAVYATLCGDGTATARLVRHRHVRFYREIRGGDSLLITSGKVADGPFKGRIVHRMVDAISGVLCTTALDDLVAYLPSIARRTKVTCPSPATRIAGRRMRTF